ncbi:AraC family transcriptional regulator [Leptospira sp. 96542]|nr:AraC family transcriptional regulator [Leptospira sp. 96542]
MEVTGLKPCHIGPGISNEQFVQEHIFFYIIEGEMLIFDGKNQHKLNSSEICIIKKNRPIRYTKTVEKEKFKTIVLVFDESFLKRFFVRHPYKQDGVSFGDSVVKIPPEKMLMNYLNSLDFYYDKQSAQMDETFADIKREELLLILFQINPELMGLFSHFENPTKIDLVEFMNRNYKFNMGLERFAFLSGRSLSAFKRDFFKTFNESPGKWILEKRLDEAYFLVTQKKQRPSEFYLDLGFEDLSHFSIAFKKKFGYSPKEAARKDMRSSSLISPEWNKVDEGS